MRRWTRISSGSAQESVLSDYLTPPACLRVKRFPRCPLAVNVKLKLNYMLQICYSETPVLVSMAPDLVGCVLTGRVLRDSPLMAWRLQNPLRLLISYAKK